MGGRRFLSAALRAEKVHCLGEAELEDAVESGQREGLRFLIADGL